jgi:ABC-type dipeptide/oligopeptide/nickel transport system permease component
MDIQQLISSAGPDQAAPAGPLPAAGVGRRPGGVLPATLLLVLAVLKRLVAAIPMLLVVSMLIFVVLRLLPADPVGMLIPPNATAADVEALRHRLGLDGSIVHQYMVWLRNLLQGDFGTSIQAGLPVSQLILKALPTTIQLVLFALVFGILFGFIGGLGSFYLRGTPAEGVAEVGNALTISIPDFLWAILLILVFGIGFKLLPFVGPIDSSYAVPSRTGFLLIDTLLAGEFAGFCNVLAHFALPAIALGMTKAALVMRVLRSSLLEAYSEEYIVAARLRGVSEMRIMLRHAFKNAVLPTVSLIGVLGATVFGGTLLIETIYSLPGIGSLMVGAVRSHDLPVIQSLALVYAVVVMVVNAVVDVIYTLLDPRLSKT